MPGPEPTPRTLLLAPASLAGHEDALKSVYATFDRSSSDLHMLDRLSAGAARLPPATYDAVVVLTNADGARRAEAERWLTRKVYDVLFAAMKTGAVLEAQDGPLPTAEPTLAGLVLRKDGRFEKAEEEVVQIRLGGRKKAAAPAAPVAAPVVQISLDDDFEDGEELIDEDGLMTQADLDRPIQIRTSSTATQPQDEKENTDIPSSAPRVAPECQPKAGKRRRACKDCTCGLAAKIEAEDAARRAKADTDLQAMKLTTSDLNDLELDFTVKGQVGSCNSCSLGDAFRCADCPYIGLPPFKVGDKVEIPSLAPQF